MKRSQMVQDLGSELILALLDYDIHLDYGKAQDVAIKLLTEAEKNGMLPPWSDAMKVCDCSMLSSCVGCAPNIFMPKWENEQNDN